MKYDKKMIMWKKDLVKNDSDMSFDEVLKSRKNAIISVLKSSKEPMSENEIFKEVSHVFKDKEKFWKCFSLLLRERKISTFPSKKKLRVYTLKI